MRERTALAGTRHQFNVTYYMVALRKLLQNEPAGPRRDHMLAMLVEFNNQLPERI